MMPIEFESRLDILSGTLPRTSLAMPLFAENVLSFLDDLSVQLRKNRAIDTYTDLKTFGFWCRAANLKKLKLNHRHQGHASGRGIALHITPSNVAMNFAYSLAFGLLAGNTNIVRLPSRNFKQVTALIDVITRLLDRSDYATLRPYICLVKYTRSDKISQELSAIADVRLIWGGDDTVAQFKKYFTKPRCLDLTFSNRYSMALINPAAIELLKTDKLNIIATQFYNDCYLMDQRGCSSPQSLVWSQPGHSQSKERFWDALNQIVFEKYDYDISIAADKYVTLVEAAATAEISFQVIQSDFRVTRLQINEPSESLHSISCKFGMFIETSISDMSEMKSFVTSKFQTMTYFGVAREDILSTLRDNGLTGIDRVVPVGRAFDMGPIWDGYDIIAMLSRVIGE